MWKCGTQYMSHITFDSRLNFSFKTQSEVEGINVSLMFDRLFSLAYSLGKQKPDAFIRAQLINTGTHNGKIGSVIDVD